MGPARRERAADAVVGGETASLLDVRRPAPSIREDDPYSRAFETGPAGGGGVRGSVATEDSMGASEAGLPPRWRKDGLHSYHEQPPSAFHTPAQQPPLPPRPPHLQPQPPEGRSARAASNATAKTRFPSLTPAPGSFRVSGDTRAAEAVAHARKTWAAPALRTQAVASYGAVPDLEVIPEDTEVKRFYIRDRVQRYSDLGCPSCAIS